MSAKQTVKILIAGGSFGGKSFFNHFINQLDSLDLAFAKTKFDITLVDPREGFINILAIPRAVFDLPFAKQVYADDYNIPFGEDNERYKLNFIHGSITHLTTTDAQVELIEGSNITSETVSLSFDYMINATGRARSWPFYPAGYTKLSFMAEMQRSHDAIVAAKTITVIGAGAVGLETVGELIQDYPDKHIILVHPYDTLPPEDLQKEFKDDVMQRLVDLKIDLKLKKRYAKDVEGGFETTDGEFIKTDLILWCGSKANNLLHMMENFSDCIDPVTQEVSINNKMQLVYNYPQGKNPFDGTFEPEVAHENIFAIGDITKFPVMKVAGGAYRGAAVVSTNLFNKYLKLENIEKELKDEIIEPWGKSMMMSVGTEFTVQSVDGKVEINTPLAKSIYKDFTNAYISMLYKVNFDGVVPWTKDCIEDDK